jgi:hypothetical protein
MKISNLYNNIVGGVGKLSGSIADYFSGKKTYNMASTNMAQPAPAAEPTPPQKYTLPDRGAEISESDFEKMRPLIYGEVSNRDFDKKALEADVIFNTALNRQREYETHPFSGYKGTKLPLSEIIAMPNQYQAYGGSQYETYYNPQNPIDVAKKKEVDAIVDRIAEKIRNGEYVDNTEGAFYYVHEDDNTIKYDNLRKLFAE